MQVWIEIVSHATPSKLIHLLKNFYVIELDLNKTDPLYQLTLFNVLANWPLKLDPPRNF